MSRIKVGDYVSNPLGLVGKVTKIRRYPSDKELGIKAYYSVTIVFGKDGESWQIFPLKEAKKVEHFNP